MQIKKIRDNCHKCGNNNWGLWTSASTKKEHVYCRACRQKRAKDYINRKGKSEGTHTKRQFEEKRKLYDRCPQCNRLWTEIPPRPDKRYKHVWTEDHINPLIQGGADDIDNIQPLCYQCNFGKRK